MKTNTRLNTINKMKIELGKILIYDSFADIEAACYILYKKGFRNIPSGFGEYQFNELAENERLKYKEGLK